MMDLDQRPLMVYWEVTRACELACRHCRAEAIPRRNPLELSTGEGIKMLDDLAGFGEPKPHLVFTGGDPLKRPDLWELIAAARARGFKCAITPSGTYALTPAIVQRFVDEGIWMMAVSLDGSNAARHDGIRMVPGSFEQTVAAANWASDAGLPFQVNTLVCQQTADDLPAIYDLITRLGATRWSLFFLIQVGRGKGLQEVSPEHSEKTMEWLLEKAKDTRLDIKTTEAPHYRRVAIKQQQNSDRNVGQGIRRGFGIRDGSGILFISHLGDVYPAGFLPIKAGNVRTRNIVDIYRNSDVFTELRDVSLFKGKCGQCEFNHACGGSRARAFAYTGDPLESDPLCPYKPVRLQAGEPALVG